MKLALVSAGLGLGCYLLTALLAAEGAKTRPKPDRWDKAIGKFVAQDQAAPPQPGEILFIGSSSIRLWDTERWFPERKIINRGFGGSWIQDSIHYADQIIFPYKPSTIVLYAGDNDVNGGLTADAVFADYVKFVSRVRERLPNTEIIFIAIKPSVKRWQLWLTMKAANERIAKRCAAEPKERFANIAPLLLGTDGKPDPSLFAKDGLHLSKTGYASWSAHLEEILKALSQSG